MIMYDVRCKFFINAVYHMEELSNPRLLKIFIMMDVDLFFHIY